MGLADACAGAPERGGAYLDLESTAVVAGLHDRLLLLVAPSVVPIRPTPFAGGQRGRLDVSVHGSSSPQRWAMWLADGELHHV